MRRKGSFLIIFGLLLIAAALFLTAKNVREDMKAMESSAEIMQELLPEVIDRPKEPADTENREPENEERLPVVIPDMPIKTVNGHEYIAALSIPSLELELPVYSTWDYTKLQSAPCYYAGNVYSDDFVICAHNYYGHFGRIKTLSVGDSVIIVDMDGNVFNYEVSCVETLQPTDVEDMIRGDDWDMTLFTCTIGGATRVTVRCERVL